MMFLIRYWRSLTKRDRVLRVLNIKLKKILHVPILHFLDAFFTDPDFWPDQKTLIFLYEKDIKLWK